MKTSFTTRYIQRIISEHTRDDLQFLTSHTEVASKLSSLSRRRLIILCKQNTNMMHNRHRCSTDSPLDHHTAFQFGLKRRELCFHRWRTGPL